MPVINVQMLEGRTSDQAGQLIAALSEAAVKVLGVPASVVLVTLTQVAPEHWGVGGHSMAATRGLPSGGPR